METIKNIITLLKEKGNSANSMLRELGLPISAVSEWKRGKSKPSTDSLIKIANYFNVTTDYLLGQESTSTVALQTPTLPQELTNKWGKLDEIQKEKTLSYMDGFIGMNEQKEVRKQS
jgi:transcriptional regulator with XRE-family HTH domain